ncbi:protein phosphatase 1 regulatory subunit 35, transcript variant X2 [Ictidomys tridecemlineatus]|uniref:protein phosphatase 1 regulatory subunit 35 isoform X2 n=1 Tax=Ictidomys tridecemlineatus TaxID=43179 RepID=UPI0006801A7B|nr:protein phosphatase 1 regulatory subunit 35 isoform X2 [Ictidomys tridecemlineatus]KAG3259915.1 protein phosphatase 1 regulatory subunit 35, transcript variant X2 [Ictidomys tridecemlineatus]
MRGCGESELKFVEGEEAVESPGPPPEPRAQEPRAPVPEPGLDLSLSPRPESPEPRNCSPGRRKGRAERRGGARRGRQVRFHLAPPSPVRPEPLSPAAAPSDKPAAPQELEAPARQSSMALSLELQAARAASMGQFDATKAVEEQLRKSFQIRCGLEDSVAEGLNVPRSKRLFRDLVSLQVPEEQVLNAALREKLALLPPQARAPPPKVKGPGLGLDLGSPVLADSPSSQPVTLLWPRLQQEPPGPGPDMTILCDPGTLFYESPHLTLDGLPPLRLQPRPRPSEDTFLMHRTLRRWEA